MKKRLINEEIQRNKKNAVLQMKNNMKNTKFLKDLFGSINKLKRKRYLMLMS